MKVNGFIYQLCMFNFWGLEKGRSLPEDYCSLFCSCLYNLILMGVVAMVGAGTILWAGVFFFEFIPNYLGLIALMVAGSVLIFAVIVGILTFALILSGILADIDFKYKPNCGKIKWKS